MNLCKCKVCGFEGKTLVPHLKMHNLNTFSYKKLYPESETTCKILHEKRKIQNFSKDERNKRSDRMKTNNPMKNKDISKKVSLKLIGSKQPKELRERRSIIAKEKGFGLWMLNKKLKEETKIKQSKSRLNFLKNNPESIKRGSKHPCWKGGVSSKPYGQGFTNYLKNKIKKRDNYRCQICFKNKRDLKTEELYPYLIVHHIDYNKNNHANSNLITLCAYCHSKTNFRRKDWIYFLKEKVNKNGI